MNGKLIIKNKEFSFNEIKQGKPLDFGSEQLNEAYSFCAQWLHHRQQFYFKTSGSTGTPKEIIATRKQLKASAKATINHLHLTKAEHILVCLNTSFIAGAMMLVRGCLLDCTITVVEPSSETLKELPQNHSYTFCSFVPLQVKELLAEDVSAQKKLERFKHLLIGGASLSAVLEDKLKKVRTDIYHTYGMTETMSHIAWRKIGTADSFTPFPEIKIKTNANGCLAVKGEVTGGEWVITNDWVEIREDGSFIVNGRYDEMIISGGLKFNPEQIEKIIREHRAFKTLPFFIFAKADDTLGQKVVMITEGRLLTHTEQNSIKKTVSEKISPYAVPKEFLVSGKFLLTATGKINKGQTLNQLLR